MSLSKLYVPTFIVGFLFSIATLSPLNASRQPDMLNDFENSLQTLLSSFSSILTETLLEEDEFKGREQEINVVGKEFSQMMTNMMFGDGSNPTQMPTVNVIHAQKRFTFLLNERQQLKTYALNLNEYSRDLCRSHKFHRETILTLIEGELAGLIPPQLGFATDYIAPNSPGRAMTLLCIHNLVKHYTIPDKMELKFAQNMHFDYTTIEHLLKNVESSLIQTQSLLNNYNNIKNDNLNEKLSPLPNDDTLTTQDKLELEELTAQAKKQSALFSRHFLLMEMERVEQNCRLFMPLFNFMLSDKVFVRTLKNQDESTYKSINDALLKYKTFSNKLDVYLTDFHLDLKSYQASLIQPKPTLANKAQNLLPQPEPKKNEQKVTSPASLTPKHNSNTRTQKSVQSTRKQNVPQNRTDSNSTNMNDAQQADTHLTDWLMSFSSSGGQPTSGKKEYLSPSEQDLKEARKNKAKEEKREKAQSQTTNNAQPKAAEIKEPKQDTQSPLFIISGSYDIFESIMNETYKGEMGPITSLIKTRFKGMAHLSHGRWHFGLRHISSNRGTVFSSTLDPLAEDLEIIENNMMPSNETELKPQRSATVVHNPHKGKSKRLRPYHVTDIKKLFVQGGYTLDTVKELRSHETTHNNSKLILYSGNEKIG